MRREAEEQRRNSKEFFSGYKLYIETASEHVGNENPCALFLYKGISKNSPKKLKKKVAEKQMRQFAGYPV